MTTTTVKDPVCKMELDETRKRESFVYEGRSYYFCSVGCRAEFERRPDEYAEAARVEEGERRDV